MLEQWVLVGRCLRSRSTIDVEVLKTGDVVFDDAKCGIVVRHDAGRNQRCAVALSILSPDLFEVLLLRTLSNLLVVSRIRNFKYYPIPQ